VARSVALCALILAAIIHSPLVLAAADQDQPRAVTSAQAKPAPKAANTKPATPKLGSPKPKAKLVQPPAPNAATPVQPVPAIPEAAKPADDKSDGAKPMETKAAPHFASLRADKVFLRSGPSADFPVQWVFVRRGLPVEILATFDIWRKIRDFDGTEGWVHQQMLTGRRSVLVTGAVRDLRHDPDPASPVVARLEAGVVAAVSHCNPAWCEVKAGGYKGWLKRDEIWGLEPDEAIP
jgi:SH3-like domain-containing protein